LFVEARLPKNSPLDRHIKLVEKNSLLLQSLLLQSQSLISKAKPITPPSKINFDDAMRRSMRVPPPPGGKKAKRRVWRKKQRKSS
jgi:hypothetical protein